MAHFVEDGHAVPLLLSSPAGLQMPWQLHVTGEVLLKYALVSIQNLQNSSRVSVFASLPGSSSLNVQGLEHLTAANIAFADPAAGAGFLRAVLQAHVSSVFGPPDCGIPADFKKTLQVRCSAQPCRRSRSGAVTLCCNTYECRAQQVV